MKEPTPIEHSFTSPIGVDVKGDVWPCVEMPDSTEFFSTGKSGKSTRQWITFN